MVDMGENEMRRIGMRKLPEPVETLLNELVEAVDNASSAETCREAETLVPAYNRKAYEAERELRRVLGDIFWWCGKPEYYDY